MAKPARRTPKPAVHVHVPVTPPTFKTSHNPNQATAGAGANPSLVNPWSASPTPVEPTAPGQPPMPPPVLDQMQGVPVPAVPPGTPGTAPGTKFIKPPTGRRPRTGDEAQTV